MITVLSLILAALAIPWRRVKYIFISPVKVVVNFEDNHFLCGWEKTDTNSYLRIAITNRYTNLYIIKDCFVIYKNGSEEIVKKVNHLNGIRIEPEETINKISTYCENAGFLSNYKTFVIKIVCFNDKVFKSQETMIF